MPTWGLMVDWIGNDYTRTILDCVSAHCEKRGYSLAVFTVGPLSYTLSAQALEQQLLPFLNAPELDRFIVCSAQMTRDGGAQALDQVLARRAPKPAISFGGGVSSIPSFQATSGLAFERLLEHLVDVHGYRRLAWLGGPRDNPDSQERERAFEEFVARRGLSQDPALRKWGSFLAESGRRAAQDWLNESIEADAFVAANDAMAIGLREILGSQVAVTGFDNDPLASRDQLTTVDSDLSLQVEDCVKLLEGEGPRASIVSERGRLVLRSSCGCAPVDPIDASPAAAAVDNLSERAGPLFDQILSSPDVAELTTILNAALGHQGISSWRLIPPRSEASDDTLALRPEGMLDTRFEVVIHSLFRNQDLFGYFLHDLSQHDYGFSEWMRLTLCLLFPNWQQRHQSVHVQRVLSLELDRLDRRRLDVEAVINSLPIWILEVDRHLNVRYVNQAMAELLGLENSSVRLRPLAHFVVETDSEKVERRLSECQKTKVGGGIDFQLTHASGRRVSVIGQIQPLADSGSNLSTLFGSLHFGGGLRLTGVDIKPILEGVAQPESTLLKHYPLGTREREVLLWLTKGFDTAEIAHEMNLSEATIRVQLHNIYIKTGVSKRKELMQLLADYQARTSATHSVTQVLLSRLFQSL